MTDFNPDYRSGRLPPVEVTAENVRRAAEIVHIRSALAAIRHYHPYAARTPGTKTHTAVRFLEKLIDDIPGYYHTHEETDAWYGATGDKDT